MDENQAGDSSNPPETPESILEALRDHREWGPEAQETQLARLVEQFPVDQLRQAVRSRLERLGGLDGEAILRLVEAYATPALLEELALALERQPDLAPDRAWEALALLEGAGVLEDHLSLLERWEELNETFETDDSLETLVAQLEEEPEGSWIALQGLGAVEPEVRAEILGGLASYPSGPGLVAFLRILTHAHDPITRGAALEALDARDDPEHRTAWAEIAHDHLDPEIRDRARIRLGADPDSEILRALARPARARPSMVREVVTALDGSGRGSIVFCARDRDQWVVASFETDIWTGVVESVGLVTTDGSGAQAFFEERVDPSVRDSVEGAPGLALGLLSGSLMLCGPATNPVLRYWLERTVGPEFQPRAFPGLFSDEDLVEHSLTSMTEPTRLILDACPEWVDRSALTYDLAEEIALRAHQSVPDPRGDAGVYRYLFEHRLVGRLEHYQRMLLWMASFWHASDDLDLARSALALAWQLSDPQHAVPAHPFAVELSTRSLIAAQATLGTKLDPRTGG